MDRKSTENASGVPADVVNDTHEQRNAEILRRYHAGQTRRELARELGWSRGKVDGVLMAGGVDLCPARISEDVRAELVAAYRDGIGLKQIAAKWELPATSVRRALSSSGIKLRRTGRPKGSLKARHELTDEQVLVEFNTGGLPALAKALGASTTTAYRRYRRAADAAAPTIVAADAPCEQHADHGVDPCLWESL